MARKRVNVHLDETERYDAKHSPKKLWHPLSLQQLPTNRFVVMVNQILKGTHSVVAGSLSGTSSVPENEEV